MKRSYGKRELPDSALKYVLEALIPYTDANLKLSFKPSAFFRDLENIERQKRLASRRYNGQSLRNEFYKAKQNGLIAMDKNGAPRLTEKGKQKIRPYKAEKLGSSAHLMVTFDIPEQERWKRRHLRLLLKELDFTKVQQSVWVSQYDHREYLAEEIKTLGLQQYLQVYECVRLI